MFLTHAAHVLFLLDSFYSLSCLYRLQLKTSLHLTGTVLSRMDWSKIFVFIHSARFWFRSITSDYCFVLNQWPKRYSPSVDIATEINTFWTLWATCWNWCMAAVKSRRIWYLCPPCTWWPVAILCSCPPCWTLMKSLAVVRLKVHME